MTRRRSLDVRALGRSQRADGRHLARGVVIGPSEVLFRFERAGSTVDAAIRVSVRKTW